MSPGKAWLVLGLTFASAGCATRIDMGKLYDQGTASTTIPYSGVRGTRQFPDYEPMGQSILTGKDWETTTKPGGPKRGSK